jgi:hypothetical protein
MAWLGFGIPLCCPPTHACKTMRTSLIILPCLPSPHHHPQLSRSIVKYLRLLSCCCIRSVTRLLLAVACCGTGSNGPLRAVASLPIAISSGLLDVASIRISPMASQLIPLMRIPSNPAIAHNTKASLASWPPPADTAPPAFTGELTCCCWASA